ncbi:hypothetical protein TNCV_2148911 [Trichonephila clavipes]|nr:hypothetical protein TNCV_2148911 [Trichonephila clavipes]
MERILFKRLNVIKVLHAFSDVFDKAEAAIFTAIWFMTLGAEELHRLEYRAILSTHRKTLFEAIAMVAG